MRARRPPVVSFARMKLRPKEGTGPPVAIARIGLDFLEIAGARGLGPADICAWRVAEATAEERAALAAWVARHARSRLNDSYGAGKRELAATCAAVRRMLEVIE